MECCKATRLLLAASALALALPTGATGPTDPPNGARPPPSLPTDAPLTPPSSLLAPPRALLGEAEDAAPSSPSSLAPLSPEAGADKVQHERLVCKKFASGEARLALCEIDVDEYLSQEDRVAQVGLYLKNIGEVGVCNLGLWVDGMGTDAQVDFWPKWVATLPNEGYLPPRAGFELGANIFMPTGFPDYYVPSGFRACEPPDALAEGTELCKTLGEGPDGDGVVIEWCQDKHFDSWMRDDGTRVIHAQGHVFNNGTTDVCEVTFSVDHLDEATKVWPKWFPKWEFPRNSKGPLRIGDREEVGAAVPSHGFKRPKLDILSYKVCPNKDDNNIRDDPSVTSPGANLRGKRVEGP